MTDTAELDRIAAEAQSDAAAAAVPAAGEPAAPVVDPAEAMAGELAGVLGALVGVFSPAFPSLASIYTEQSIGAASNAVAAVCVKRGWLSGGIMGEYGEEVMALIVCGPLAVATWKGVKGDMAKMHAAPVPEFLKVGADGTAAEPAPAFTGPAAELQPA